MSCCHIDWSLELTWFEFRLPFSNINCAIKANYCIYLYIWGLFFKLELTNIWRCVSNLFDWQICWNCKMSSGLRMTLGRRQWLCRRWIHFRAEECTLSHSAMLPTVSLEKPLDLSTKRSSLHPWSVPFGFRDSRWTSVSSPLQGHPI